MSRKSSVPIVEVSEKQFEALKASAVSLDDVLALTRQKALEQWADEFGMWVADLIYAAEKDTSWARWRVQDLSAEVIGAVPFAPDMINKASREQSMAPVDLPPLDEDTADAEALREFLLAHVTLALAEKIIQQYQAVYRFWLGHSNDISRDEYAQRFDQWLDMNPKKRQQWEASGFTIGQLLEL